MYTGVFTVYDSRPVLPVTCHDEKYAHPSAIADFAIAFSSYRAHVKNCTSDAIARICNMLQDGTAQQGCQMGDISRPDFLRSMAKKRINFHALSNLGKCHRCVTLIMHRGKDRKYFISFLTGVKMFLQKVTSHERCDHPSPMASGNRARNTSKSMVILLYENK